MSSRRAVAHLSMQRVIDFNFFPAKEMDESWWDSDWLATSLFLRLRPIKGAQRKLSQFILHRYQLSQSPCFDFSNPERQVALLGSADLKAVLYALGLMIESDTIANAIEREAQQAIKQSLGIADYFYALKNRMALVPIPSKERIMLTDKRAHHFVNFKHRIYQSGLRCLLSLLDDAPPGFVQRLLFKLPRAWSVLPQLGNKSDYQALAAYLPRLLRERVA